MSPDMGAFGQSMVDSPQASTIGNPRYPCAMNFSGRIVTITRTAASEIG